MIDLSRESRNVDVLIKTIKPILECGKFIRVYHVKNTLLETYVLAYGKTNIVKKHRLVDDYLSGLKLRLPEFYVMVNNIMLFSIKWYKTRFKIIMNEKNPFVIKILTDSSCIKDIVKCSNNLNMCKIQDLTVHT